MEKEKMKLKKGSSMGFGMVLAGFILLFNPMVHVIDIIPDVIGFLLIAVGLRKTSFFISRIDDARRMFWKLVLIEGVKIPAIFLIPYGSVVPHQAGSTKVLFAFVFALVELIAFIPAVNYLIEGISFAGTKYSGELMYEPKYKKRIVLEPYDKTSKNGKKTSGLRFVTRKKKVELITSTKNTLIAFYVLRNVMTVVPELTELQMYEFVGNVTANSRPLTYYKGALYFLCFTVVIISGIFYIRKISKLIGNIRKDEALMDALRSKFERDIMPRKTLFMSLDMKMAIILFAFSVGTSFVFYIDGVNVFVGCISAGFMIAAAAMLGKYVKGAKIAIPLSAVRAALAIYNLIGEARYFSEYGDAYAVEFFDQAYEMYYPLAALKAVENLVALASMIVFITALLRAVREQLPICGVQVESVQYSKKSRDAELYESFRVKMVISTVFTCVNFALCALGLYLLVYNEAVTALNMLFTAAWAALTIYSVIYINTNLYNKEIENS